MMKKPHITSKSNICKQIIKGNKPQQKVPNKQSAHSKSMDQLEQSFVSCRENHNKQNIPRFAHHSSLLQCQNSSLSHEEPNGKSKSMQKFLEMFGENHNDGKALLPENQRQQKKVKQSKRQCYNGFCYDLKIGTSKPKQQQSIREGLNKQNSTLVTNRSKDNSLKHVSEHTSTSKATHSIGSFVVKRGNQSFRTLEQRPVSPQYPCETQRRSEMEKKLFTADKKRKELEQINTSLRSENSTQRQKISDLQNRLDWSEKRLEQCKSELQTIQKREAQRKQLSCQQHTAIIQSLKKVINEQLNKIIDLERLHIEAQLCRQQPNGQRDSQHQSEIKSEELDQRFQESKAPPYHNSGVDCRTDFKRKSIISYRRAAQESEFSPPQIIEEASDSNEQQDDTYQENPRTMEKQQKQGPSTRNCNFRSNERVRSKFETQENRESQDEFSYDDERSISIEDGESDSILEEVDRYLAQHKQPSYH